MKKLSLFLAIILLLVMLLPAVVHADEVQYGNAWVYDEPNVISAETEEYIRELNESKFASYANKPQLAFIIINDLPYKIEDYKLDMFNEYGVGTAQENHGMLFVIAINDREYALEIGDGFAKGSILRKELEKDFITSEMKNDLRNGNYDAVVKGVTDHLAVMMKNENDGIYQQQEADAAAAHEQSMADLRAFFDVVAILVLLGTIGGVIFFASKWIIETLKRNKTINDTLNKYSKHMTLLAADEDETRKNLISVLRDESPEYIIDAVPRLLCQYYVDEQIELLREICETKGLANPFDYYRLAIAAANQVDTFSKMVVFDVYRMIEEVDEDEAEKAAIRKANNDAVEEFLSKRLPEIADKKLQKNVACRFNTFSTVSNRIIPVDELNRHFNKSLKEISFEMELDKFCQEHKSEIDGLYFDRSQFLSELKKEGHYARYQYTPNRTYNNFWMMHFLMLHIASHKRAAERREQEEREARERRRREEEARRQRQQIQSHNSTFGSGFGGGFSSGGGFKGGW